MKKLKEKTMWYKFKKFILKTNIESWLSLYILINMFILYFNQDMNSTNILIQFYSSFILVFVLGGISKLRTENEEIKKLIEEKTNKRE